MVKRGIENRDLRHTRQVFPCRPIGLQIVRIVQRSENTQLVDLLLDLFVDDHRLMEAVSAMHNTMAYGIHRNVIDLVKHRCKRIRHAGHALDLPFGQDLFGIRGYQFRRGLEQVEFQRGTSRVQDQYLHAGVVTPMANATPESRACLRRGRARIVCDRSVYCAVPGANRPICPTAWARGR